MNELRDACENYDFKPASAEALCAIIQNEWNTHYGTVKTWKRKGVRTLILITGGWSENEGVLSQIRGTTFWNVYHSEWRRGGYWRLDVNIK